MLPDKLVYKANQIARFYAHRPEQEAAEAIAEHFRKFWDPRMREAIISHHRQGDDSGLAPAAVRAVELISTGLHKSA